MTFVEWARSGCTSAQKYPVHLKWAKRDVRSFLVNFSDEKLAQIYAFNQDGRMSFRDSCGCLLGVATAEHPHTLMRDGCPESSRHYVRATHLKGAEDAEGGYFFLGFGRVVLVDENLRRVRFSAILRAEMRLRSRNTARIALQDEKTLVNV